MYPEQQRISQRRLTSYDYTKPGAYFVTICIHERLSLLGAIANNKAALSLAGEMISFWWLNMQKKFEPFIKMDTFIVMPDHIHGIIWITDDHPDPHPVGADRCVCPHQGFSEGRHIGRPLRQTAPSIPRVIQWFKTMTTNTYIHGVKHHSWQPFNKTLWQRNYYDRIIRNESELIATRNYVLDNPRRWQERRPLG